MHSFLFDIGGVLINYSYKRFAEDMAAAAGVKTEVVSKLLGEGIVCEVESGRLSCEDYYSNHISLAVPGVTYGDWITAWMDNYTLNLPGLELFDRLKENKCKIYILSNLADFNVKAIERKFPGFFEKSDGNFFSYRLCCCKPDAAIFNEVCRRIGQKPEELVFLDDNAANVNSAAELGLTAICFSNDQLCEIYETIIRLDPELRLK